MLDGRSEQQIMRELASDQEARRQRLERLRTGAGRIYTEMRPHAHLVEILVVIWIVLILGALLLPRLMQARNAAYLTSCVQQLRSLGQAMEMYHLDHRGYPPAHRWHVCLHPYLSLGAGEEAERMLEGIPRRLERTAPDPLRCPADDTTEPVSYYYLDMELLGSPAALPVEPSQVPMLVDERNHGDRVPILWYGQHQTVLSSRDWALLRGDTLAITVAHEVPESYSYVPRRLEYPAPAP